ncbi:dihydrofolate reductase family protein [Actinomycetospora sp. NBRC 106378]|uniref:dihydrofolate reductase family protein n=1 Tax=Actinomycetospora sp. NBRC 106378 TaxID=3032208 RepID=UPI0024A3743A|nr:dihydrofolate reductase family protein [Actinomycetospora sp. NBRC 106378]GLZ54628.1 deaminase reductase [Actinomycetospora sp. NBRC 106378]
MHIVVTAFTSLDGVVQAPGGPDEDRDGGFTHGGWSMPYFDPEVMGAAWTDVIGGADAMLFGRRTWEVSGPAWSAQAGDPFADRLNGLPKYVASRTLTDAGAWANSTVLTDLGELPEGDGRLVVMGSASVVRELVDADLVDEYRLMIEPVLLGGGKSIFPQHGNSRGLALVEATTAATGTLVCTYRRG